MSIGVVAGAAAGCGGSDVPVTSSAQGGAPAASSTSTTGTMSTPATAPAVYQQSDIPEKMNNRAGLPACPTYLANEAICGNFFNYLLAWQPNATQGATPQLGYQSTAAPIDVGAQALVWLPGTGDESNPGKGADGGPAVAGPPTSWDPSGDDGAWHWGPGQCGGTNGNWKKCDGKKTAAVFADRYLIEWTDEGANEANGTAYLNMSAGDVDLGQVFVEMYNEGEEGGGRCRTADRNAWPPFVVCGSGGTHDAQMRCDHRGDANDQCAYGFWFRNYPVRITVRDQLPDSTLQITGITADNFKIAKASTLKDPSTIDITTGEATRYLVGFRRFNAADLGDEVVINGIIRSTTDPPDKWSGSTVTMRARLGSDRIGDGGTATTGGDRPQGSACNIEKASSETSTREPQCSVVSPVTKGGPGQLNDVTFYLR